MTNVENCDESNIMSNFEIHSTPSASQEKIEVNVTDTSNVTEDSGVQLTPTSTKYSNKVENDMMSVIINQLEKMNSNFNSKFDGQNSRFDNNDIKLNEIKSEFNSKFDTKFEEQSRQFNELKIDINEVKIKCESSCNELKQDIEKIVESVGKQIKSNSNNILSLIHI